MEDFGNVLNCEVLRDRQGRSFGEAEIEFSSKDAALDCIAALDNRLADGRYLGGACMSVCVKRDQSLTRYNKVAFCASF